jgi:uncharacterized protein
METLIHEIEVQFGRSAHIAHGFDHVERSAKLARYIAEQESFDPDVAEIAGYLHDIGRTVQEEEKGHGPAGVEPARQLLDAHTSYDQSTKQQILDAIRDHSMLKTEGRLTHIVQDADMLDGLGAVGIMRGYTSRAHLPCYTEDAIIATSASTSGTLHQQLAFQMEWLDFMHTDTGRRIAISRHKFMQDFLKQFEREVLRQDING